jgi:hypothetical protein
MTSKEMGILSDHLKAPEYFVFGRKERLTVEGGAPLTRLGNQFGEVVGITETVTDSILWNNGGGPAFIRVSDAERSYSELIEVPAGTVLAVGDVLTDLGLAGRSVSVSCGVGYYACCYGNGGTSNKARCRKNGTSDADCTSGGAGSTGCTIGE